MNLTSQENTLDNTAEELMTLIEEVKSMIGVIDGKFRWCNLIIPDEFDSKQMNFAHAMYVFKVHIIDPLTKLNIKKHTWHTHRWNTTHHLKHQRPYPYENNMKLESSKR